MPTFMDLLDLMGYKVFGDNEVKCKMEHFIEKGTVFNR